MALQSYLLLSFNLLSLVLPVHQIIAPGPRDPGLQLRTLLSVAIQRAPGNKGRPALLLDHVPRIRQVDPHVAADPGDAPVVPVPQADGPGLFRPGKGNRRGSGFVAFPEVAFFQSGQVPRPDQAQVVDFVHLPGRRVPQDSFSVLNRGLSAQLLIIKIRTLVKQLTKLKVFQYRLRLTE